MSLNNMDGLVILNALNNLPSIQKSLFGPNAFTTGIVTHSDGKFEGNSFTGTSRANRVNFNDASILLDNNDAFALTFWGEPIFSMTNGVVAGSKTIFGINENNTSTTSRDFVAFTGDSYWQINATIVRLNTLSFLANVNQFFSFVKDVNGIDGTSDTLRVYIDDVLLWSTTTALPSLGSAMKSLVLGSYFEGSTASGAETYFDNVELWDYAKTSFSGRFYPRFDQAKKRR